MERRPPFATAKQVLDKVLNGDTPNHQLSHETAVRYTYEVTLSDPWGV